MPAARFAFLDAAAVALVAVTALVTLAGIGGRPATLRLTGSPDRLTGTLEVRFLDRVQTSRVHGRLDPKNGALILEDEDRSRPDAGAYTAHLASDRSRLTGTFHTFAGGRVTGFSMSILP